MSRRANNVMRQTYLQLKSGYLKEEPLQYTLMKKHPPLNYNNISPVTLIDPNATPFVKYYQKAVRNDPILADEQIFPAYWQEEPQALTLAKRQHELIQQGISEEDAYAQAMDYVKVLENKSYVDLRNLIEKIKETGATLPFSTDAKLAAEIASWHEKLRHQHYSDMTLADQGEIDFIIQTKVLKWKEVERERRMKDPIFVMQFEKLRNEIFPEILGPTKDDSQRHKKLKENILDFFEISQDRLRTKNPFFLEDYQQYFNKLREQPMLSRWSETERSEFSHWIVQTLAMIEIIERRPIIELQHYLDLLRAQFFPMINYPHRAKSYQLPTTLEMKSILYQNDIGYKTMDEKVYIRRYYKLPMLLFPEETFAATLLLSDVDKTKEMLADPTALLKEITSAGFSEKSLPEIREQLETYVRDNSFSFVESPLPRSTSTTMDFSSLDELLRDQNDKEDNISSPSSPPTNTKTSTTTTTSTKQPAVDLPSSVEEQEEEEVVDGQYDEEEEELDEDYRLANLPIKPQPSTLLEQEREAWLQAQEYDTWEENRDDGTLEAFERTRMDIKLLTRARCAVTYEDKEGARRKREWERRGVWMNKFPTNSLRLV